MSRETNPRMMEKRIYNLERGGGGGAIEHLTEVIESVDNSLIADTEHFYFDKKDGVYGYNTDESRGADTFHPFSAGGYSVEFYEGANGSKEIPITDDIKNVKILIAWTGGNGAETVDNIGKAKATLNNVDKAFARTSTRSNMGVVEYDEITTNDTLTITMSNGYGWYGVIVVIHS